MPNDKIFSFLKQTLPFFFLSENPLIRSPARGRLPLTAVPIPAASKQARYEDPNGVDGDSFREGGYRAPLYSTLLYIPNPVLCKYVNSMSEEKIKW